ncbi:hypothetical protein PUR71_07540 [Streptomyces sp. SP17BM10]|uniref:hypothetical protein n=1 Tax=Streptomyces sp. SP17BM10 TaxID=3002530 RepID=UPI002E79ADB9|nr:hypothetical protein [Streptomyces sp. SP17BM10]MEE1782768.1 hypothetical protein [Streptomyces sp. SP17BM10]
MAADLQNGAMECVPYDGPTFHYHQRAAHIAVESSTLNDNITVDVTGPDLTRADSFEGLDLIGSGKFMQVDP